MGWIWDKDTMKRLSTPKPPRGTRGPSGKRVDCLTAIIILGGSLTAVSTWGLFHLF